VIKLGAYGEGARPRIDGGKKDAIGAAGPIGGWHISSLELTSDNNLNPLKRIEAAGTCGIRFSQEALSESLVIEDCLIHHCSGPGIYLSAYGPAKAVFTDTVIRHCEISFASCGIQFAGAKGEFHTDYFTRFHIAHTTVHDIGGDGIVPFCSNHGVVEYCTAYRTGLGVYPADHSPVAIWFAWSKNSVIQFCEAFDNHTGGHKGDGGGFDIDGGCTGCVMQYNYSHDNDGAGYLLCSWDPKRWPTTDCVCRFNLSVNDGLANDYASIEFWQADKFEVYNNTCVTRMAAPLKFISDTKGHLIANNLFVIESRADIALVKSTFELGHNGFKNNLFWRGGGAARFELPAGNLRSLAAFHKALTGPGKRGPYKATGNFEADPRFADPRLYNYRLAKGSPALGKGLKLKDMGGRDFYGAPLKGKLFVGCAGEA